MNGKAAGVCKSIKNLGIFNKRFQSSPVFSLIKEIACFLPIFNINQHLDFIFKNYHLSVEWPFKKAFLLLQTFQFSYRNVISFIYAFRFQHFIKNFYYYVFMFFNSQRESLKTQVVSKFIYNKAGNEIRFSEYYPAATCINHHFSVFPGF